MNGNLLNNASAENYENELSSDKIMKMIDVNAINSTDKKRRGRPKKTSVNDASSNNENNIVSDNEEIILHLNLTKQDIETYKKTIMVNDIPELNDAIDEQNQTIVSNDDGNNNNGNNNFNNNSNNNNGNNNFNNNNGNSNNNFNNNNGNNNNSSNNNLNNNNSSNNNLNNSNSFNNNFNNKLDNNISNNNYQLMQSDKMNDSMIDISSKTANALIRKLNLKIEELSQFIKVNMPMYFTKVNSYPSDLQLFDTNGDKCIPKLTTICCWHDTEQFDTFPVFIPQKYYAGKFYVFGCFCSFNCACAYNLSLKDGDVLTRHSNLIRLFYEVNKNKIENIKDVEINPAGRKEKLKKFGGSMTISEFRENSKMLGRTSNEFMPNCHQIKISYDEIITSKNINKSLEF